MTVIWLIVWFVADRIGDREPLLFDPVNGWAGALPLAAALDRVDVAVANGVVKLTCRLHSRSDVELLGRLAARVPGMVAVESSVEWQVDDRARRGRRAVEPVR